MKTEETFNCNAFFPGLLVVPVKTDLIVKRQFVVTTRDNADLVLFVNFNASIAGHQCLKSVRRRNRSRRKGNKIKQIKKMIDYRAEYSAASEVQQNGLVDETDRTTYTSKCITMAQENTCTVKLAGRQCDSCTLGVVCSNPVQRPGTGYA